MARSLLTPGQTLEAVMDLTPMLALMNHHRHLAQRAAEHAHRFSPCVVERVVTDHRERAEAIEADIAARLPELEEALAAAQEAHTAAVDGVAAARERQLRGVIGELEETDPAELAAAEVQQEAARRDVETIRALLESLTPIRCEPAAILTVDDQLYPLSGEEVLIGRGRGADIQLLTDHLISRRHCALRQEDGGWWLVDLRSANGTWLGGRPIDLPRRLLGGEVIQIGETTLRFALPGDTEGR